MEDYSTHHLSLQRKLESSIRKKDPSFRWDDNRQGFTLIELSIVLVVIGLIIGGVLVGQDLIWAAKIRQQVNQLQEYEMATIVFKDKYGALPADIDNPATFGFTDAGVNYVGNKDRKVTGSISLAQTDGRSSDLYARGEAPMFWQHLSESGLIKEQFTCDPVTGGTQNLWITSFPKSKMDEKVGLTLHAGGPVYNTAGSVNYWFINKAKEHTSNVNNHQFQGTTPYKARALDEKIDDGKPLTGRMVMTGNYNRAITDYAVYHDGGSRSCMTTAVASTAEYTVDGTNDGGLDSDRNCMIRIKAGF